MRLMGHMGLMVKPGTRFLGIIGVAAIASGCGPSLAQCRNLSTALQEAGDAAAQARFAGFNQQVSASGDATENRIAVEQSVAQVWTQAADEVKALKVSGRELKTVQADVVESYREAAALSLKAAEELSDSGEVSEEVESQLATIELLGDPLDPSIVEGMRKTCASL